MLGENARRRRPGVAAQLTGEPSGVIRRRADARIKRMTSRGTVRAIFNYTRDTGIEPEIYFYNSAHGAEGRRPGDDPREMTVPMGGIVQPCFLWIARGLHCVIFARHFSNGKTTTRSVSGSTEKLPSSSAERSVAPSSQPRQFAVSSALRAGD